MTERLLLDTHSLVWWLLDDPRLSTLAAKAIAEPGAAIFVSAASAWEIATKVRLNKMPEMSGMLHRYELDLVEEGFRVAAVEQRHGLLAGSLPGAHGDPFDRMIAAQAMINELTVITRDAEIAAFGCKVLW